MFVYLLTNTLDLSLWSVVKIYNLSYYVIYGSSSSNKTIILKELKRIQDRDVIILNTLESIQKKINHIYNEKKENQKG